MPRRTNKTMAGILFIAFAFLLVFIFLSLKTIKTLNQEGELISGQKGSIGVVEVNGIILDSKKTIRHLLRAEEDQSIQAIIVRINSPGGAVGPAQEIYQEIRRIDEKKPIYASLGAVAASGGYYISSAARKIFANPGTLTGSIGVIMQFMNLEKLFEFLKIDPNIVKAGRYKDIGTNDRKMTPYERQLMQKMIDGVHRQFIADILKTRKDRIQGNIEDHAQGQIFSGEEAQQRGLVDELMGLQQGGRSIHQELQLPGDFALKYFKEKKKFSFEGIFEDMESLLGFPTLMFLMNGVGHGTGINLGPK